MIGIATHCHQTAMHLWMQGLYSPVHHFRKARQVGNVLHVQTSLAQGLGRSSGRYQFDAMTAKCPTQLYQTVFVGHRSEEHTSELQSLMRISYAVFCLKKKKNIHTKQ